ncbi:MAG: tRNA (uridine(54)-C5)-methyltransferase TrmA [Helicobacteraceae bacterium]|nr:tRNA (uridine(54)-C5)-methyltransferase TrmA [Helicobacteraceae bacterium]
MICKHFGECGSCVNYVDDYATQLSKKVARIKEQFEYKKDIFVASSSDQHYRSRSEFKIWHKGDEIFYAMNSIEKNKIVFVEECPKVSLTISNIMEPLLKLIKTKELDKKLFSVDFLCADSELLVTLIYHKKLDELWSIKAKELADELGIHIMGRSRKQKVILSQDFVTQKLQIADREYSFKYIENSFTQPNPKVNEKMTTWAMGQCSGLDGDLLELYCGAGNFTIPFATKFNRVLATEISKTSISAAKENMSLNGVKNIEFVRMSAEEFTQALDSVREFRRMKDIDINSYELKSIFVDPPRAGLDEQTLSFVSRFENIIYVSCNPDTLKRDLDILSDNYEVLSMALFDQFAYTNHVEMGIMLKRKV